MVLASMALLPAQKGIHAMNTRQLTETELDRVSGGRHSSGAEVSMIELQSLVAKRAVALQLTSGVLNALHELTKAAANNIR